MTFSEDEKRQLIEDHADYLFNVAVSRLTNRELAKDFVQETFLSALQHLEDFKGKSAIRTWLTSILIRKIIDHWRKAETKYTDPASDFFEKDGHWKKASGNFAFSESLNHQMDKSEEHQILLDCVEKLPEQWKGILQAKVFEEKKSEEVCKEFDVTASNLWIIIHRSKLLLRKCVEKIYNYHEM